MKKILKGAILTVLVSGQFGVVSAQDGYTLDRVYVSGIRDHDQYGNIITEQSYYRTGGDVTVIDRETLEKRHYSEVSDALRRVPGVTVRTPGYRGGEYGYTETLNVVSINGDDRVIVLVDGRRVDNSASNMMSNSSARRTKSVVDVNKIIDMSSIEKIEVIKGPGASAYGSDATGGVINIITKKGGGKPIATADFSTGSWSRHHYHVGVSGSTDDKKISYAVSFGKERGKDSWYHDGLTGRNLRYFATRYNEETVNARVDLVNDNNPDHVLSLKYSYMNSLNGYPLTAPDHRYFNEKDWTRIREGYLIKDLYGDIKNPGYRNNWYLWAITGSHAAYRKNTYDITYQFSKDQELPSFIRLYEQNGEYSGSFGGGDEGPVGPVPETPEIYEWAKAHYKDSSHKSWIHKEKNRGIQFQYGKKIGKHAILGAWTYDKSQYNKWSRKKNVFSNTERSSFSAYLQDKIDITDNWQLTPAIRFLHLSSYNQMSVEGVRAEDGEDSNIFTASVSTQYAFSDDMSMYFSWNQVIRPLKIGDVTATNGKAKPLAANLKTEEGNVWTIGFKKSIGDRTSFNVNYALTRMDNAVAQYSVWDKDLKDFSNKFVNAKQDKKAFNISLSHKLSENLSMNFAYTYFYDKWSAKGGMIFDPDISEVKGNINIAINRLRPVNVYQFDINYVKDKWDVDLLGTYYTGASKIAFTDSSFLVLDFSMNYQVNKDWNVYANITNLTNTAWQTTYNAYLGLGAWPQQGRALMVGTKVKF